MKKQNQSIIARSGVAAILLGLAPACALEGGDSIEDLERSVAMEALSPDAVGGEIDDQREIDDEDLDVDVAHEQVSDRGDDPGDIQAQPDTGDQTLSLGAVGSLCGPGSSRNMEADFNGDGVADLAIGVPMEEVNGKPMAGAVNVIYGNSGPGLDSPNDEYWHQDNISGGVAEEGDHFGWALTAGDFNCDTFDDLAIGVPDEDIGAIVNGGVVHVLYGSPSGLLASTGTTWHQNTPGILGVAEENDRFGYTLAAGNFDNRICDDLAVGVPLEDLLIAGGDEGMVNVIYSRVAAGFDLSPVGDEVLRQGFNGIMGLSEPKDYFGAALVTGDFNADMADDLAMGVPGEDDDTFGTMDIGVVHIMYGVGAGVGGTGLLPVSGAFPDQIWDQASTGVETNEIFDYTGISLATGDFDGSGEDDLAIGVPYENLAGGRIDAGVVIALEGSSASGLTAAGSKRLRQGGIYSESAEAYDMFGLALAAGDFDGSGEDDLAAGVPGEDFAGLVDAGRVQVYYGTVGGLSTMDQVWDQDTPGIKGLAEAHDQFGSSLTAGDYDASGEWDLTVGVPLEDIGSKQDAGWVNVIYGAPAGLVTPGDQIWHQSISGIKGSAEQGDMFGCSLR